MSSEKCQKVLRKSAESPQKVIRESSESPQKGLWKSSESSKKIPGKSSESMIVCQYVKKDWITWTSLITQSCNQPTEQPPKYRADPDFFNHLVDWKEFEIWSFVIK